MSDEALFHPVANIFPLMRGAELDALAKDIRANGQQAVIGYDLLSQPECPAHASAVMTSIMARVGQ